MSIQNNLHAFIWQSAAENNCNTYLIDGPHPILIDPGHKAHFSYIIQNLEGLGKTLEDIELVICTHAHPDHMEAVQLFQSFETKIAFHEAAWQMINEMRRFMLTDYQIDLNTLSPDFFLQEGDFYANDMKLEILHTPGHSPGSICLYWPEQEFLFSGDVVFNGGLGRTDLPGGNGELLKNSIKRLETLDIECIYPGHGDVVAGSDAVEDNFKQLEHMWFRYL